MEYKIAGTRWFSKEEKKQLVGEVRDSMSIFEISKKHSRSLNSIKARIRTNIFKDATPTEICFTHSYIKKLVLNEGNHNNYFRKTDFKNLDTSIKF